ncbi:hypothetical protein ACFLU6_14100, partial [Acidobacteriota bacterium]
VDGLEYVVIPQPWDPNSDVCTAPNNKCTERDYVRIINTTQNVGINEEIYVFQTIQPNDTELVDTQKCNATWMQAQRKLIFSDAGDWCQINPKHPTVIFSDDPDVIFQVYHYARGTDHKGIGDPYMLTLVPREAWICNHRFVSMEDYDDPWCPSPSGSTEDGNYITIIAPSDALDTRLDDNPLIGWNILPFPFNDLMWVTKWLPDNPYPSSQEHWVEGYRLGQIETPVGVYVHGYSECHGSYAYPAGMRFW